MANEKTRNLISEIPRKSSFEAYNNFERSYKETISGFKIWEDADHAEDIIYTEWTDKGKKNQKTLKWNGRKFSF